MPHSLIAPKLRDSSLGRRWLRIIVTCSLNDGRGQRAELFFGDAYIKEHEFDGTSVISTRLFVML